MGLARGGDFEGFLSLCDSASVDDLAVAATQQAKVLLVTVPIATAQFLSGDCLLALVKRLAPEVLAQVVQQQDVMQVTMLMAAGESQTPEGLVGVVKVIYDALVGSGDRELAEAFARSMRLTDKNHSETFAMKVVLHQPQWVFEKLLAEGVFTVSPEIMEIRDFTGWALPLLVAARLDEKAVKKTLRLLTVAQLEAAASLITPTGLSLLLVLTFRHSRELVLAVAAQIRPAVLFNSLFNNPHLQDLHRLGEADKKFKFLVIRGARGSKPKAESPGSPASGLPPSSSSSSSSSSAYVGLDAPKPSVPLGTRAKVSKDLPVWQRTQVSSSFLNLVIMFCLLSQRLEGSLLPESDEEAIMAYLQLETSFLSLVRLLATQKYSAAATHWMGSPLQELFPVERFSQRGIIVESWFRVLAAEALEALRFYLECRLRMGSPTVKEKDLVEATLHDLSSPARQVSPLPTPSSWSSYFYDTLASSLSFFSSADAEEGEDSNIAARNHESDSGDDDDRPETRLLAEIPQENVEEDLGQRTEMPRTSIEKWIASMKSRKLQEAYFDEDGL